MIKQIIWTYKLVNFLIGLRGLRGIKSKNGVFSIEIVIFLMESLLEWLYKLFGPRSELIPWLDYGD